MHSSSCLFLYNDPATTENYTYRHTLSLHYARPILVCSRILRHSPSANPAARAGDIGGPDGRYLRAHRPLYATLRIARVMADRRDRDPDWQYGRSEEHTSELQSLMRNSYAVFCLKKKKSNDIQNTYNTITQCH